MTRTITVKGVGTISAKPDFITLALSIAATDKNYDLAMEDAANRIQLLQTAADRMGFEKDSLKTVDFHVNTQYDHVQDDKGIYQNVFSGYKCSYHLKLAFDFDSKRLADILSAIANSCANPELNIFFTVKHPEQASKALLASAAANAKEKAEILCRASGAALGQLINISYNWNELTFTSKTRFNSEQRIMPMMAASKIQPDDIHLQDTATFVWELL